MAGNIIFDGWINDDGSENFKCRAWVNFNGAGTVAIRASGNVSSITDNGVGDYTVNFTSAMPDTNYAISIDAGTQTAGTNVPLTSNLFSTLAAADSGGRTINSFRHIARRPDSGATVDVAYVGVLVFR